ncbi:MAG TPA: hypothetical protein VIO62_12930, partial [Candidatus Dormibacteraeota bacterium]
AWGLPMAACHPGVPHGRGGAKVNLQGLVRLLPSYDYNRDRPHRSLNLQPPLPTLRSGPGPVASRPVLGGLHHVYARAA